MAPRHDVENVALLCERPGPYSTLCFPNDSRAKFHHDLIPLANALHPLTLPGEWGCCDVCDRWVPREQLHAIPVSTTTDEGIACERCWGLD